MLANLLFFITGSFKVPYGGFANLKILLRKIGGVNKLLVAHTCSLSCELSEKYDSKEMLENIMIKSITEGSYGFYIG